MTYENWWDWPRLILSYPFSCPFRFTVREVEYEAKSGGLIFFNGGARC
jgi:hypothetical protein